MSEENKVAPRKRRSRSKEVVTPEVQVNSSEATITNLYKGPLGLPDGQVIKPKGSVKVNNINILRNHDVVKAWLSAGVIEIS